MIIQCNTIIISIQSGSEVNTYRNKLHSVSAL